MNKDVLNWGKKEIEISVIANHFVEKYLNSELSKCIGQIYEQVRVTNIPYEVFADVEYERSLRACEIIVVWLDLEFLFPPNKNISMLNQEEVDMAWRLLEQIYYYCVEKNGKQLLWISFDKNCNSWRYCGCLLSEMNPADELNYRMMKQFKRASIIDINQVIALEGIERAYYLKHTELWNIKFGKTVMKRLADEIYKQFNVAQGKSLKCIVTDCDNVLWHGILSEDGMENIAYDGIHRLYQRELLNLYQRGIILCIASKNDKADVEAVLEQRERMLVNRSHFVCLETNWGDKVESIQRISEILNIGLNSILFVDDSTFEIENVKQRIPEIKTCLFDEDILAKLSVFNLSMSVDSTNVDIRQMTYRDNVKRAEAKSEARTYEDYLKALDSKVKIEPAKEEDINRIAELTQRTNKLTNGMRFTAQELLNKLKMDHVYKVALSDKFGDLGVVGAMSVSRHGNMNYLEIFCLSCRALGRNIEKQMAEFIKSKEEIENCCFIYTGKNDNMKTILGEIGEIVWDEI
ncbi:MAG: HAD-IIIC family phosphatase [Lachnospiraceae bacterium]|nr:HAD-IIIC family phosphatase [Lachnospiraceae bacterium]